MDKIKQNFHWVAIALIVTIFAQSFPFKFGLVESVTTDHIFTSVGEFIGWDLYSRYGGQMTAAIELLAILLLLREGTRHYGAVVATGLMIGAIFFHLTAIGISVPIEADCPLGITPPEGFPVCTEQDPSLFVMAWIALASAVYLVLKYQDRFKAD